MIHFDAVSFAYLNADGPTPAVDEVSFELAAGESLAVVGANGSGKSTLVRLVNGLLLPSRGTVSVDGMDTRDPSRARDIRTTVGVVFQRPDDQIVATSVEDDVAFGPENLGLPREEIRRRVDEMLAAVGLTGMERREPHLLSGGQKQRLAIAGALAMSPRYLVFDEPTSMIDPQGRVEVQGVLARLHAEGRGVLLVTHDLMEAATCDRVMVLERGRQVFAGAPADLFGDVALLHALGLELPPLARLVGVLAAAGVPVSATATKPSAVVDALCH